MIREERPGVDAERLLLDEVGQARHEVRTVGVVPEDRAAFQAPHHHVMERVGCIETCVPRHDENRTQGSPLHL